MGICVICKTAEVNLERTHFCKKCRKENKEKINKIKTDTILLLDKINQEKDKEKIFNFLYELRAMYRNEKLLFKPVFIDFVPNKKITPKITKYLIDYEGEEGKEFHEWVNKKDGITNGT